MRVAILEDDQSQAFIYQHWLIGAGHSPCHYRCGTALMAALDGDDFDAYILDWNVPDVTGIDVLSRIRQELRSNVPIVVVTARTLEEDVVHALQAGADAYLSKPVQQREFLARLDSVARRTRNLRRAEEAFEVGRLRVEIGSRRMYLNGKLLDVTAKDFDLAVILLRNVGRLLPRELLIESIWGEGATMTSRTLDTHISRVRRKLWLTQENGWRLAAAYGRGYRLESLARRPRPDADE